MAAANPFGPAPITIASILDPSRDYTDGAQDIIKIAVLFDALLPGLMSKVLAIVNQVLPQAGGVGTAS